MTRIVAKPITGIIASHAGAAVALWWLVTGQASPRWLLLSWLTFVLVGLIGVDGGYHRVVAHRSLRPRNRGCLVALLLLAVPAAQGSAMSWATSHRIHHATADGPGDPHSPADGFWHAYLGWMFGAYVRVMRMGMLRDRVLQWQHRHYGALLLGCWGTAALAGADVLVYGLLLPAAAGYASTGIVNALSHRPGRTIVNLWWFWPLVGATANHKTHHDAPGSGRYGRLDPIWFVLRFLCEPPMTSTGYRGTP
jgi:stearoyl-CoA desaturase (Delta-9 desaturase)